MSAILEFENYVTRLIAYIKYCKMWEPTRMSVFILKYLELA